MSGVSSTNVSGLSRGLDQILKSSGEGTVGATSGFGVTVQSPNFPGISKVESPFSQASREQALDAKLNFSMALKGEFGLSEKVIKYIEAKIDIHSDAPLKLSDAKEILSELHVLNQVKNGTLDKSHMQGLKHFTLVPKPKEQVQEAMSYTSRRFAEFGLDASKDDTQIDTFDSSSSFGLIDDEPSTSTSRRERRSESETIVPQGGSEPRKPPAPPMLSVGNTGLQDFLDKIGGDDKETREPSDRLPGLGIAPKEEPKPKDAGPVVVPTTSREGLSQLVEELRKRDGEPETKTSQPETRDEIPPKFDPVAEKSGKTSEPPPMLSVGNSGMQDFLNRIGSDDPSPREPSDTLPGLGIASKEEIKPKDTGPVTIPKSSSEGLSMLVDELRKRDIETGGSR